MVDAWMNGQGPAHLFVYYQKAYKINENGEVEESKTGREEFHFTDGKI
jgi:hypothetical protein